MHFLSKLDKSSGIKGLLFSLGNPVRRSRSYAHHGEFHPGSSPRPGAHLTQAARGQQPEHISFIQRIQPGEREDVASWLRISPTPTARGWCLSLGRRGFKSNLQKKKMRMRESWEQTFGELDQSPFYWGERTIIIIIWSIIIIRDRKQAEVISGMVKSHESDSHSWFKRKSNNACSGRKLLMGGARPPCLFFQVQLRLTYWQDSFVHRNRHLGLQKSAELLKILLDF